MVDDSFRPYAAAANIKAVLQRARTRNLPEIVNNDFLRIVGIPEIVYGRVMQALRFLGLIQEDGTPTDKFEAIAGSTDDQYRELLDKVVREAYRKEFEMVDPSKDPQSKVRDAFRRFQPRSQTNRMVMLFLSLCREAGIGVLDAPRLRRMQEFVTAKPSKAKDEEKLENRRIVPPHRQGAWELRTQAGMLMGVTEDDVAALTDDEFKEVWSALGKVAQARARAKKRVIEQGGETKEATTDNQQ